MVPGPTLALKLLEPKTFSKSSTNASKPCFLIPAFKVGFDLPYLSAHCLIIE